MQHDKQHTEPHRSNTRRVLIAASVVAVALATAAIYSACLPDGEPSPKAMAKEITSRHELIGGPAARSDIGDFILQNDKIRVIIEKKGFAKGNGLFGGSLIDADLVHQNTKNDIFGGNGKSSFGEFFPAFFLEMVDPEDVVVVNDGSDGKAAIIEVQGRGGEFVTMLRFINQAMVNSYDARENFNKIMDGEPATSDGEPLVRFTVRYILEPGARHVRVESSLINASGRELEFPNQSILDLMQSVLGLDLGDFSVPTGSVLGFGKLNSVFLPGIGYDLRWGLEEAYMQDLELPAFPGQVTPFVASSNKNGPSYGFVAGRSEDRNFVHNKDEFYGGDTSPGDMLLLFNASGFGGVFTHDMPRSLEADETFTFTNYLIVGHGDVASILDEKFRIRDTQTQRVAGYVYDEHTGEPVGEGVSLLIYEARSGADGCAVDGAGADAVGPSIYSQAYTRDEGHFKFNLPPGRYCYRTRATARPLSDYVGFEVGDEPVYLRPRARSASTIEAQIVDSNGAPIPGKLTLVGTHEHRDELKRHFLYDLVAGEGWRTSDLIDDDPDDAGTRRYVEAIAYASADGRARLQARPGTYDVFLSRGTEYNIVEHSSVTLEPGKIRRVQAKLERVVDTSGYLSGDFHLHARGSIDSGLDYNERVISSAAEGIEVAVASDHNYVSDYKPYIYRNALNPWMTSVVGVELTTFEFGHFNAFPLAYEPGSVTGGSVPWQNIPPQEIFDHLRERGSLTPEDTIIQVNHPRDSILGYFDQYNLDAFDSQIRIDFQDGGGVTSRLATSSGPAFMRDCREEDCRGDKDFETTFSWDFDAIEILNGKHLEKLRHFRIPYAEGDWPEDTAQAVITSVCTDEHADELEAFCDDNDDIEADDCEHPLDGYDVGDWCSFELDDLHERYPQGQIVCDDDDVAFPGTLDDWYNTLNYPREFVRGDDTDGDEPVYKKYTATGNSDSHAAGVPEFRQPGSPRNYFFAGHDDPERMRSAELAGALASHKNIVTNGPFATMSIGEASVGDEIAVEDSRVDINVTVRAADWVGADRFRIMANGEPLEVDDDQTPTVYEFELDDGEFETTVTAEIDRDTWFVLEVEGDNNLFPVYTPAEIPQVSFDAAIGGIAESFGLGLSVEGMSPVETFPLTPFAFTNPIWVVYADDGDTDRAFVPPAPPVRTCEGEQQAQANALMSADAFESLERRRLDAVRMPIELQAHDHDGPFSRTPGQQRDVRVLFEAWGHTH